MPLDRVKEFTRSELVPTTLDRASRITAPLIAGALLVIWD